MDRSLELSRWLARRAVPAITGLIIVANLFMVGVLILAARDQNAFSAHLTTSFVRERYDALNTRMREISKDYAGWEAAYANLNDAVNTQWAFEEGNFGSTLASDLGIKYVFVLSPEDKTTYAIIDGALSTETADEALGPVVRDLANEARRAGKGQTIPVTATLFDGDTPILAVASVLSTGDNAEEQPADTPMTVVIFGRPLTAEALGATHETDISGLRVERGAEAGATGERLPIATMPASPPAFLVWEPPHPGTRLIWLMLPWIILAAAALGVLTALVLRHALSSAKVIEDKINEVGAARDAARHMSYHDAVTGLPNRAQAIEHLTRLLKDGEHVAALFLDLDRFKPVNDAFGHTVGDLVLAEVGQRVRGIVPESALVARIGGDEFLVLLQKEAAPPVEELCERLIGGIREPIELEACELHIGLSIGIACGPEDADEALELIRRSDLAMFQAKRAGRSTYVRFTPAMNERIRERPELERDLWRGIEAGEFELHYQPRFECRSLRLVGFEALLRWNHPVRGLMQPGDFLELAEETGVIRNLGAFAVTSACRTMAPYEDLSVSVNISPSQLRSGRLIEIVSGALAASGLEPCRLELELTETMLIEDSSVAATLLDQLKALGVRLALDDFGTGYSALGYLRRFPFDRLKIDQHFVADLGAAGKGRAIVQAIIGLARALKLSVTAEGVETAEQLMLLQADQCDEAQGFLLGRPVPADRIPALIRDARDTVERRDHPDAALRSRIEG
ncbi:EAL domain-containing protein [Bosea sp. 117]|uniref:putative bifunctional diguanylate cyclase/phosphodiesterase n=1 Tax=Bosea sp. 117 TaxID=1125973 RepID=UPI00068C1059|nr:EAL domain-containing protein [Bosea sp. 117]